MTAESQLADFMAKFTSEIALLAQSALAILCKRFPNAVQMVCDNYSALVIGFGPTERASEAIFSIAIFPRSVSLCFLQRAPELPDPENLLQGSGNTARHIRLERAEILDRPAVKALIAQAVKRASVPLDSTSPGKIIIKSVSAKQRPRRPSLETGTSNPKSRRTKS